MFYISHMNKSTASSVLVKISACYSSLLTLLWSACLPLLLTGALLFLGTAYAEEGLSAAPTVLLTDKTQRFDVAPNIQFYEDTSSELSFEQILELRSELFLPNTNDVFHLGFTESTFWLKVKVRDLRWNGPKTKNWLVELSFPPIDHIEFFALNPDGNWESRLVGNAFPFYQRGYDFVDPLFDLHTGQDSNAEFYIRLKSSGSIVAPIAIWDKDAFLNAQSYEIFMWGAFYGLMAVMFFYNLFVYMSVRDISYLYYLGYLVSVTLIMATLAGHAQKYAWPYSTEWNQASIAVLSFIALSVGTFFARSFLHTKELIPRYDRILKYFAFTSLGFGMFCWIRLANYADIAAGFSLIFTALVVIACIHCIKLGSRPARYFFIAWLGLLVGLSIFSLSLYGLIMPTSWVLRSIQLGTAFEVVLLSLGLADRINEFKRETIRVQQMANHELAEKNEALKSAIKAKDEFLGLISHELRTPMNGVIGALDLAEVALKHGMDKPSLLRAAKFSAGQMSNVLESMLTFIELQAGKVSAPREVFNVLEVIKEVVNGNKERNDLSGLDICLRVSKSQTTDGDLSLEQPRLEGVRIVIERVLDLLINNAIKFTPEGRVTISVCLSESQMGHELEIAVADTGIGIPEGEIAKVSQTFYQVNQSFSRTYGGLGMGLANCQLLLKLLRGRMHIESPENTGTTVKVNVPIEALNDALGDGSGEWEEITLHSHQHVVEAKTTVLEGNSDGPKTETAANIEKSTSKKTLTPVSEDTHILIVEDNPTNMMVMKAVVKKMGAKVSTAENGQLALDFLQNQNVDLILMDCQMPVMDGLTATQKIRESKGQSAKVPILAVTANATLEDRTHCLSVGMNDHIAKPIKAKVLGERIEYWLNEGKLQSA